MSWSAASGTRCGSSAGTSSEPCACTTASASASLKRARSSSSSTARSASTARRRSGSSVGVRLRAQHALEAPVALHDEVVVDVLGVEVGGPERVVVGRDRAEAREQEVGAGQQQRQRVRGAPDVGGRHQRVVAGARLEVVHHREQVLGDHLAHAVGHRAGDVDAVDAAVLRALRAGRARHGEAARLEVEHRAALGRAHQALGARARGEAHLEPARGVAGGQERLRPGRVVAVDEDLLGAVDRDRLGVRRQARACRARARGAPRRRTA